LPPLTGEFIRPHQRTFCVAEGEMNFAFEGGDESLRSKRKAQYTESFG